MFHLQVRGQRFRFFKPGKIGNFGRAVDNWTSNPKTGSNSSFSLRQKLPDDRSQSFVSGTAEYAARDERGPPIAVLGRKQSQDCLCRAYIAGKYHVASHGFLYLLRTWP